MAGLFDQFVAFGVDSSGLERILRGVQSLAQIFAAWPLLLTYVSPTLSIEKVGLYAVAFNLFQSRIGLTRRVIRTFRFLDSFNAGWLLVTGKTSGQGAEVWLDALSQTALGIYGMLETITLLDVMEVPGLEWFGPAKTKDYNRQAMIYWFAALLASALSGLAKMSRTSSQGAKSSKGKKKGSKGRKSLDEKGAAAARDARSSSHLRELTIRFVADTSDMIIPAAIVGWVDVDAGVVASVMLVTTFLTSRSAWFRCGREVAAKAR